MSPPVVTPSSVVVLGGGLSGLAAAYTVARAGATDVTVLEGGAALGGLAGSFEREGYTYPLGYHHILAGDRTLLFFLDRMGALSRVRWRRIAMLFRVAGGLYDLGTPRGFLRFPMSVPDKLRFVRLMLRAFATRDWSDWEDRSAAELVDAWAGPGVRRTVFEPLCRLKFDLPCEEVSGAWLGTRLHAREGSSPLGYIPHANWTTVLCDGMTRLVTEAGVRVRLCARITALRTADGRLREAELIGGERIGADMFISSIPTDVYRELLPGDATPHLVSLRYTALLSLVCATRQRIEPDFYWMNLASLDRTACAIFRLSSLNPTLGAPGESCVNFVTHLRTRQHSLFAAADSDLLARYLADFREVFGFALQPSWSHLARVPMYSPILDTHFRNVPVRSATWANVYFAGNYRTFPSVVSTGTALRSGLEAGQAVLSDLGLTTDLPAAVDSFRIRAMPRARRGTAG